MDEESRTSSKKSGWAPILVDYFHTCITNLQRLQPHRDTMPMTGRAKVLTSIQGTAALVTSLLVVTRAMGLLGG